MEYYSLYKKEWTVDAQNNMDEFQNHYAEGKETKVDPERFHLYKNLEVQINT